MNPRQFMIGLADLCNDWIDGDWVVEHAAYDKTENGVQIVFENGTVLWVTVEDIS